MFILLLDANKAVNSVIISKAQDPSPCSSSSLSRCTLSDPTLSGRRFCWMFLSLRFQGLGKEGVYF